MKPPRSRTEVTVRQPPPRRVLIVSDDDETLMGTQSYLSGAGFEARAARSLPDAWGQSSRVDALLLFPDGFDRQELATGLMRLLSMFPRTFAVLVTGDPRGLASDLASLGEAARPVILPKPVWGWSIVDVLRRRAEGAR